MLLPPVALLIAAPGLARGADEPPTVPAGLVANIYSATAGGIGWQRSSDDRFVRGYEVARDGDVLGVFDALSYIEDSLAPATAYRYTVTAIDSAGQRSDAAAVTLVTAGGAPPAADGTATVDEGSLTADFGDGSTLAVTASAEGTVQVDIVSDGAVVSFVDDYRFEVPDDF